MLKTIKRGFLFPYVPFIEFYNKLMIDIIFELKSEIIIFLVLNMTKYSIIIFIYLQ